MYPYRVFLSYAHADRAVVEQVSSLLQGLGLVPVWDRNIRPASRFTDFIRDSIDTAHVFMPLLTEHSLQRPWVHQETGYALGRNVPVLPLAMGGVPGEMIAELHALPVSPDLGDLVMRLTEINLDSIVLPPPPKPSAAMLIAETPEDRTRTLVEYAKWLLDAKGCGHVRQRGLFSSFAIPAVEETDLRWDRYDGPQPKSGEFRRWLLQERALLERNAREMGCSLIIAPELHPSPEWRDVHRFQIETCRGKPRQSGEFKRWASRSHARV